MIKVMIHPACAEFTFIAVTSCLQDYSFAKSVKVKTTLLHTELQKLRSCCVRVGPVGGAVTLPLNTKE